VRSHWSEFRVTTNDLPRPRTWWAAFAMAALSIACSDGGDGADDARSNADSGMPGRSDAGGANAGGGSPPPLGPADIATQQAADDAARFACDDSSSCGGDPSGSWDIREFCLFDPLEVATAGLPICADLLRSYDRAVTGSVRIDATGFRIDMQTAGRQDIVIDDECAVSGGSASGATPELCAKYESQWTLGNANRARCVFEAEACACELEVVSSIALMAPIEVGASALKSGREVIPFCVEEDTLRIEVSDGRRRMQLVLSRVSDAP
jgi:hypothetical protein